MDYCMAKKQYFSIGKFDKPDNLKCYPQETQIKPQFYALIDKEYKNYFDLYFSEEVTIEDLKNLPTSFREYVLRVDNDIKWNDAKGFAYYNNNENGKSVGKAFHVPHGKWFTSKPIGIVLTMDPNDRIYTSGYKNVRLFEEYKEEDGKFKSVTHNKKIEHNSLSHELKKGQTKLDQSASKEDVRLNTIEGSVSCINFSKSKELRSEDGKETICCVEVEREGEDSSYKKSDNKGEHDKADVRKPENIKSDSIQYLISGHDGETFFFDGSPTNKTGASFKIEYDSKTMKGEFSLIVDFNNLKAINPGFRRCVIKMVNNEASIKEASSFIMIEKGQAHYSEQDKVWMVDKSLVIKLLK